MSGASGGYMYPANPVAGTVFRDATMNPQYPLRAPAPYSSTMGTMPGGRAGRVHDQQYHSRPWTTGAATGTGTASDQQPRPATVHNAPTASAGDQ